MRDKKKIQKLTDFETKKSVHINLSKATHAGFRTTLFEDSLSMQEVFERFAYRLESYYQRESPCFSEPEGHICTLTIPMLSSFGIYRKVVQQCPNPSDV